MTNTTRSWSPQQSSIFDWFRSGRGNLVVRARAGTGKTTTILEAIEHAPEAKILLAAFNKRIQVELAAKLRSPRAEAKTLHSLGFAYVRRQWSRVQVDSDVTWEQIRAVAGVLPNEIEALVHQLVGLGKNMAPFGSAADLVNVALERDCVPEQEWEDEGWTVDRVASIARQVMNQALDSKWGRISFDDMVFVALAGNLVRPWFNMVVVDEAQDMNASQLMLAQRACKKGGRIVVVGDDRQAIYGFRGADSGSLDRLKAELGAAELGLTITYRCPKNVVALAQQLVPDYMAADTAPEGTVDSIMGDQLVATARAGDVVLSRKNAPLMSTCLAFLRAGVPSRIEGRDIGKMLLNLVKKMKARSVPQFLEKLAAWKKKQEKRAQKLKNVDAKLQEISDQYETLAALAEGAAGVSEVEGRCSKLFEDSVDEQGRTNPRPAVVCSSVHKAKGLEWERCFLLDDTFLRKRPEVEERNVEYVAITRSKSHLTWVKKSEAA